jgi:hypothetical protein
LAVSQTRVERSAHAERHRRVSTPGDVWIDEVRLSKNGRKLDAGYVKFCTPSILAECAAKFINKVGKK